MSLQPKIPFSFRELPADLAVLKTALQTALAAVPEAVPPADRRRVLNLACGRADETAVLADLFGTKNRELEIVGADIRAPEIDEARRRWTTAPPSGIQTRFHLEDGRRLLAALSSHDRFDVAILRHQNFWNDPDLWAHLFDGALEQLHDHGLLVITSYFDHEHQLACQRLASLGAEQVAEHANPRSRALAGAPGKSVDRHLAIFRRPRPS